MRNKYIPSVYGVGFLGEGIYTTSVDNIKTLAYVTWINMIKRCYSKKLHLKRPTYIGCTVHPDWHNFQNFSKWFEENNVEGWHLDKDILFKGNKIYSSETCCFVPPEINTLFIKSDSIRGEYPIGVTIKGNKFRARIKKENKEVHIGLFTSIDDAFDAYKLAKKEYVIELADKWKPYLTIPCYESLVNYKIEITD